MVLVVNVLECFLVNNYVFFFLNVPKYVITTSKMVRNTLQRHRKLNAITNNIVLIENWKRNAILKRFYRMCYMWAIRNVQYTLNNHFRATFKTFRIFCIFAFFSFHKVINALGIQPIVDKEINKGQQWAIRGRKRLGHYSNNYLFVVCSRLDSFVCREWLA